MCVGGEKGGKEVEGRKKEGGMGVGDGRKELNEKGGRKGGMEGGMDGWMRRVWVY